MTPTSSKLNWKVAATVGAISGVAIRPDARIRELPELPAALASLYLIARSE